jgi:hypothetical protein
MKGPFIKSEDLSFFLRLVFSAIPAFILVMTVFRNGPLPIMCSVVVCGGILWVLWRDFDRKELRDVSDRRQIATLFESSDRRSM